MVSFSGLVHAGLSLVWIANGPAATNAMADHSLPADLTPTEYIDRNDSDFPLLGYISYPDSMMDDDSQDLLPTVIIVPVSNKGCFRFRLAFDLFLLCHATETNARLFVDSIVLHRISHRISILLQHFDCDVGFVCHRRIGTT